MVTQYDDKGKIFTQVVSKHPVRVIIRSAEQTIHGTIHIRPDQRVKDELNGQDRFLAVTNAVVYNSQNDELYRSAFVVINIDHIVWVIPEDDLAA